MHETREIETAAHLLFSYLVDRFPVMCSSDEFHFLPRLSHPNRTGAVERGFDADLVDDTLRTLKTFRRKIESISVPHTGEGSPTRAGSRNPPGRVPPAGTGPHPGMVIPDLERYIDRELLLACIAAVTIELEEKRSWRLNPLLYLKSGFIGLDKALSRGETGTEGETGHCAGRGGEDSAGRLRAIPGLLRQAEQNIRTVPETWHDAALSMTGDCLEYLQTLKTTALGSTHGPGLDRAGNALLSLRRHLLGGVKQEPDGRFASSSFSSTLRDHFHTQRSPDEIFDIGREEWEEARAALEKAARESGYGSWHDLYASYRPVEDGTVDLPALYREESEKLVSFFRERAFGWVEIQASLRVVETPLYLRSVRGSASFSAAVDPGESDLFYITTITPGKEETRAHTAMRLHREYRFLAAHEGFPGHYLLDTVRRGLDNPVRRAFESPLFYEGWAYYAESLLEEEGYVEDPLERVVHKKRKLWRAARCMIDAGLASGRIGLTEAVKLLQEVGYTQGEAEERVRRFRLNPGYQLCYSLGRYEIVRLRNRYGGTAGGDSFHRDLLQGGQVPFTLAEKRFQALARGDGR